MTEIDSLYRDLLSLYHDCKYSEAVQTCKALISSSAKDDQIALSVDLGHLLCLSGKYAEAAEILPSVIKELESGFPCREALSNAYLSYAICLLNLDEYGKYCFYLSKYLDMIKCSDPAAYEYLIRNT